MSDAQQETVVERLMAETLVKFTESASLPTAPGRTSLRRFADEGVANPLDPVSRIYLEDIRIGNTRYTSREAWARFCQACSATPPPLDSEI